MRLRSGFSKAQKWKFWADKWEMGYGEWELVNVERYMGNGTWEWEMRMGNENGKRDMGNGKLGTGNGTWEMGNGKLETGNGNLGMENGKWEPGNWKWGMENWNGESQIDQHINIQTPDA